MPEPVNFNDRVLIVGKTGSGKTTFARHLIAGFAGARHRVVDPKGRLRLGVEPARSVAQIDWRAPVAHFIPSRYDRGEYEELYAAVFHAGGPQTVWTDESGGTGPTTGNFAPRFLRALQAQGRELGMGHVACATRPVNIAPELRSEAEHFFIFPPPPHRSDLETLAVEMGMGADELARELREIQAAYGLGPHRLYAFLWWHRATGEIAACTPVPAAA